ncbi:MAG TPA: DUF4124 domain-containing protein [Burkholderiales bacterium]|nr:DUF4124 domain-containing protein [Burkholderiales bacterium]
MKLLLLIALMFGWTLQASAEIYKCVDSTGAVTYTNKFQKGCKSLHVEPNIIYGGSSETHAQPQSSSPKNFPKVDSATQKSRDEGRRQILEKELANEETLLDNAKEALATQKSVRYGNEHNYQRMLDRLAPYEHQVKLHEDNIASIKQELDNLK